MEAVPYAEAITKNEQFASFVPPFSTVDMLHPTSMKRKMMKLVIVTMVSTWFVLCGMSMGMRPKPSPVPERRGGKLTFLHDCPKNHWTDEQPNQIYNTTRWDYKSCGVPSRK